MARADHIKGLIFTHLIKDDARFRAIALQIAAHEAHLGHAEIANEIRQQFEKQSGVAILPASIKGLLEQRIPTCGMADLIVHHDVKYALNLVLHEQRSSSLLLEHGLVPRRKLLLIGPPGTGKTMTAMVLATELSLPLYVICLDRLITKFLGETAENLRKIFDFMQEHRGIYFFDEFDALESDRGRYHDVEEMRRILNSFLIMLEQENLQSIIVAATNLDKILDRALWRRFDTIIHYTLPAPE